MSKINFNEKFALIVDYWSPAIVGELNGQLVKIAKVKGEFPWHKHEIEDELFMVHKGKLTLEFRDRKVVLMPGEMYIIGKGVEHHPMAEEETEIIMFEPASTLNTGNVENEFTKKDLKRI